MSLYLVSGTAGTGKTSACNVLKQRGYEAYDTDDDGLARWQHNETRYIHPKSSVKPEMRTAEFLGQHSWNVPREHIENLTQEAKDHPIFVCGALGNESELHDLFKMVFALYVDDATLLHRLANRTTNDWGKQPQELERTMRYHHRIYDMHRQLGDFVIDASQPLEVIVDEILTLAHE